jgi:hypothetical protein
VADVKRRTFVFAGLGVATTLAGWQTYRLRDEDLISRIVFGRLDYLRLDEGGVRQFSRDLTKLDVVSESTMRILSGVWPLYSRFALSNGNHGVAHRLRHGEDRIAGAFLISSDFFINGSDEARLVRYLGMLDPRRACGNPFARFVARAAQQASPVLAET